MRIKNFTVKFYQFFLKAFNKTNPFIKKSLKVISSVMISVMLSVFGCGILKMDRLCNYMLKLITGS